jgi:hypothetical protein
MHVVSHYGHTGLSHLRGHLFQDPHSPDFTSPLATNRPLVTRQAIRHGDASGKRRCRSPRNGWRSELLQDFYRIV